MNETNVNQTATQKLGCSLDLEALAELRDLLEEDFFALLQEFISSSEQTSTELTLQLQQQNLAEVRRSAHSLKGSALNVGAPTLGACWAAIEDAAVQSATAVELEALLQSAQTELELTNAALQEQCF